MTSADASTSIELGIGEAAGGLGGPGVSVPVQRELSVPVHHKEREDFTKDTGGQARREPRSRGMMGEGRKHPRAMPLGMLA